MIIQDLLKRQLIQPPKWLPDNCAYLTIMGSMAYGTSDNASDEDIYGFCFPPKELVFPHLTGEIPGFGNQIQRFEQWQQHHIVRKDNGKEYDLSVFSIVKYFQLCMENNPNMIDSLFTPQTCIKHITPVGQLVRDNRKLFLHKGSWHKFRGYAYSQIKKMDSKDPKMSSKRRELVDRYGYDVKFATHTVRLIGECEQILLHGDINLTLDSERLKAIRRGEWTREQVKEWFYQKEKDLEKLYHSSTLPHKPDELRIKQLLWDCLESHYGTISQAVVREKSLDQFLSELDELASRYRNRNE